MCMEGQVRGYTMCKQSGVEEGKGGYTWGHTVNKQSLAPVAVCMEGHVRGYTMCKQSEVEEGKGRYTWGHTVNKASTGVSSG